MMRLALVAAALALASCNGFSATDRELGAPCRSDSDCQHRCVSSRHFPDGLCTLSCTNDSQCPNGAACVDEGGGLCEVQCGAVRNDCGQLGLGFVCDQVDRAALGGTAAVCRVP